jgi:transposase
MEEILECCCGLDVHRDTVVACILAGYGKSAKKETKTFSTRTCGIRELAAWLESQDVKDVVIESTGVYWRPIFNFLEDNINVVLANPYHVKNAKGRKTDVKDAEWLCRLFKAGSISASFIPPKNIRTLREKLRYRLTFIRERSRVKNRIIKLLESWNIKLSSVFSDVFGYTCWLIITKIIEGERNVENLTSFIHKRCRSSIKDIQEALEGTIPPEDLIILQQMAKQVEQINNNIAEIEHQIDKDSEPFNLELELLQTIPGISRSAAVTVISEIGVNMEVFPSHEHLASWAALCPGNNESAGKKRSGRTRRGNNYLKTALVQAAWAASRTKNTYLQSKFKAMVVRKGGKKTAVAISHKILVACYHMLKKKVPFNELGAQYLDQLQAERRVKYYVKKLEEIGYYVTMVEKVKDEQNELVFV